MLVSNPKENEECSSYKTFPQASSAQSTIDFFNKKSISVYTNSEHELVGGVHQEWKTIVNQIGQHYIEHHKSPTDGEDMGELEYVLKKLHRLDCPIILNPQDSTFLDVAVWAYFQKRLSISTIEKRLRYARYMENHSMPVNFRNPTYENFRRHMDYREEIEGASPNALVHEWKTMRMFLESYGIPRWPYKPPHAPEKGQRLLPFPDTVKKFFSHKFSDDAYKNALYQYLFYHSFMIGWRIPSEICEMTLDDVHIDSQGRGSITITETKKHSDERVILPEKYILSSRSHKSLKIWIDKWRPRVENQYSGDALYLWPSGKPVTVRKLGHKLSEHGKKIYPHFRPYDMRHWCAVSRLIETKIETGHFEPYTVKNWLGHTDIKVTENYIHYTEMYYHQYRNSCIHSALRSPRCCVRGKHEGKPEFGKKQQLSPQIVPVEKVWARRDLNSRPTGYQPVAPTDLSYGPLR